MKLFLLIMIGLLGVLLISDSLTGYAVIEACPQVYYVYSNNITLIEVNESIKSVVEDFYNTSATSVKSFVKDEVTYYLVEMINGPSIRECVTDLIISCSCVQTSFS